MSSYIITSINSNNPIDQITYRTVPNENGAMVYEKHVTGREWKVELIFQSSGDVSDITHDQLSGLLFKILSANPIQP